MGYAARAGNFEHTDSPVRLVSLADGGTIGVHVSVVGFFEDLEQRWLIIAAPFYDLDVRKLGKLYNTRLGRGSCKTQNGIFVALCQSYVVVSSQHLLVVVILCKNLE